MGYDVGKLQPAFEAFRGSSPADLTDEIALLRTLANQAIGEGHYARAATLLGVLAKASSISQATAVRATTLLESRVVGRIAMELVPKQA